jgi:molybdate/tungstate transport system ATP-binding protein
LPPAERGVGYVPQDRALFPTMLVREQLAFALVLRALGQAEIAVRVDELAELLGITGLLDRTPDKLSGGEAQRVALGRALAHAPAVLCLDEPLAALDEELHGEMCRLLERVHRETGVTVLHITHSPSEAKRLAGCHFRLADGKVTRDG